MDNPTMPTTPVNGNAARSRSATPPATPPATTPSVSDPSFNNQSSRGNPVERLWSIDALRGFDMLWIMGAERVVSLILSAGNWSFSEPLAQQLEHVEWEGFRFYDLIFPLFLFLVGCVLPFSLEKFRDRPSTAYWRLGRRTMLLVLLGLLANDLLQFQWDTQRWPGVLQRIGIGYGAAGLLYVHLRTRGIVVVSIAILLGYWAILTLIPVPGGEANVLTPEGNLAGYIDRLLLPGKIYPEYYGFGDNEGILSTLPAVVTALLGVLAGKWLRADRTPYAKVGGLLAASMLMLAAGYGWGMIFPIIKNLWTSSFVLVAGGWSTLLLACFYLVIDVWKWRAWSLPLVVVGANAITIYFLPNMVDFTSIAKFVVGGLMRLFESQQAMILAIAVLAIKWLLLWFLFRKKIFLRV
jgi:predicted acyltransferase